MAGRVYSGGWVTGSGGDAAVIEPATGAELGRTGIGGPSARAATGWITMRGDITPYPF
jgi:benzaldehyde dehydrogenase (NAD)